MKFVNPRNDVAFKKIFGNEEHTSFMGSRWIAKSNGEDGANLTIHTGQERCPL